MKLKMFVFVFCFCFVFWRAGCLFVVVVFLEKGYKLAYVVKNKK